MKWIGLLMMLVIFSTRATALDLSRLKLTGILVLDGVHRAYFSDGETGRTFMLAAGETFEEVTLMSVSTLNRSILLRAGGKEHLLGFEMHIPAATNESPMRIPPPHASLSSPEPSSAGIHSKKKETAGGDVLPTGLKDLIDEAESSREKFGATADEVALLRQALRTTKDPDLQDRLRATLRQFHAATALFTE